MRDIPKAVVAFIILVAAMTFIGVRCAKADRPVDGWFPRGAVAYIGIDRDLEFGGSADVPYCHNDSHSTGVFGARIPVYRWTGRHSIVTNLEHNSCLEEEKDAVSDDRIGIRYEYMAW